MFGIRKKKSNNIASDLSYFLDEADRLYIRAFETRSIGILKTHFTVECCRMISRWIVAEASSRYFSEERFRDTLWEVTEESPTMISVIKKCVYKDIKLSLTRTMKVSEDYTELWCIQVSPDEYWVSDIQSVEGEY